MGIIPVLAEKAKGLERLNFERILLEVSHLVTSLPGVGRCDRDTGTIFFEGLQVVGETARLSAGFAPRSVLQGPCGCNLTSFFFLKFTCLFSCARF